MAHRFVKQRSDTDGVIYEAPNVDDDNWPQLGVDVEVYSATAECWVRGEVAPPVKPYLLTVRFLLDGTMHQKNLYPDSKNLRPLAVNQPRSTIPGHCGRASNFCSDPLTFLASVPLFRTLPVSELEKLAASFSRVQFHKDQVFTRQGELGKAFVVLVNGVATVDIDGTAVVTLQSGDYFGENSLLHAVPCNATVAALSAGIAFSISRDQFLDLGLREKLNFPKRRAVFGGHPCQGHVGHPKPKNEKERQFLLKAIQANSNLQACVGSDNMKCHMLVDTAWKQIVPAGQHVIRKGDLEADFFYIVQEGTFEATTENVQRITSTTTIGRGGSFGELALIHFQPRAATIVSLTDSVVWVIDRTQFQNVLAQSADDRAKEYVQYMKAAVFATCTEEEKMTIARSLNEATFTQAENIIEQGEIGNAFYILLEGHLAVFQDGNRIDKLMKGSIFGERALLTNEARAATVTVMSPVAKAVWMDKDSFQYLLPHFATASTFVSPCRSISRCHIQKHQLVSMGLLGTGGFGAVELVEVKSTSELYALKVLSKGFVMKSGMQSRVMREKSIQLMCDSKFVVKLYETYNEGQSLYFLLELASGGEVYMAYCTKGLWGIKKYAQYYVAATVLAFEHLHVKKIAHRDLKPENLLIDGMGHAKLADFGLSKKIMAGKTYTTCGTPLYFAPEMILHSGHTSAVDWWALGVVTFELMVGETPFSANEPPQIYRKIIQGMKKVHFPDNMEDHFSDFVKSLCKRDPSLRLPATRNGGEKIKMHEWYNGFDWEAMQTLTLPPPYKPPAKRPEQLVKSDLELPPQLPYTDDNSGWDEGFASISS